MPHPMIKPIRLQLFLISRDIANTQCTMFLAPVCQLHCGID